MEANFDSPSYKRSRRAYIIQAAVEYFISLLVADALFAKLLTSIGISDALTGIISSIITIAFGFQLLSLFVVRLKISKKKIVLTLDTISVFFFLFLYLIPFLPFDKTIKTILVVVGIVLAYMFKYVSLSIYTRWVNSFVDPIRRASFSATKEIISLLSGIFFTLIVGYVIDYYEAMDNINGGFLFVAIATLILNICNFICIAMVKKENPEDFAGAKEPMKTVLSETLGNKNFRNVIVLISLSQIGRYFTAGFLGVYKTKDLALSLLMIQAINTVACVARMLVSKPFGRYTDKNSFAKGMKLGLWLVAASFFVCIFTTKSTWYLIIVHTVLYYCGLAGIVQNETNILYSYVDAKYISQAHSIMCCIVGVLAFAASAVGGKILDVIQNNGNMIFGISVYGQQVLAVITVAITLIAILYDKKVIEKQKVMIQ